MKVSFFTPRRLQVAILVLPAAVALLYMLVFSANRYVSESIVAVRSANPTAAVGASAISLGTGASLGAYADTLYLMDYIESGELLEELDRKLNLRAHYESPKIDFVYRLWDGTSREWFLKYYRHRIDLEFNDSTGLITVRTQGFTPEMAKQINDAILAACERFVNDFSQRVAREQMKFSEGELALAASKLDKAKNDVVQFQSANKMLDPAAQQMAASSLTAELQASIARLEADLKNKLSFMQPDAPAVTSVRDQVAAYKAQLEAERLRTTSTESGDKIGTLNANYQRLALTAMFAEESYRAANTAYQAARIEAGQKVKSLVVVTHPLLPESALYPRILYNLLTLLVICCVLYIVARLAVATIQEHQD
ncbi:MAG: capsular biosynthesis protein [Proteobacteria bacterium]|nr:capsular biosynthesis protein [Pseudomonadota bacterium]